jgi:serine/threonine-protein kinase
MSPEQAMGAAGIDGRTDVFAFGGILFESLTGQRAFDAPNFNALIVTIATKQPKSIDDVSPQLPEPLRALVRDCMVTDKTKRLASFDLIAERLTAMMPELEKSEQKLPSQYGVERSSDPDATNALPVIPRKSDRPPPPAQGQSPSAAPPGGHPSPLAMQITNHPRSSSRATDSAVEWLRGAETYVRSLPPRTLMLAAGGAGAFVLLVVIGIAAAFTRGGGPSRGALHGSAVSASTGTSPVEPPPPVAMSSIPSADDSADVPTFSVDSLPVAVRGAPSKGNGRLSIVAKPGWCSVSVDGQPRGVTPLSAFELPAGTHRVDCVPPSGKPRTSSVNVAEGTATHYTFALDE